MAIALAGLGTSANAGGFDDKDFSLRFPAALSRFSSYADVAATGGASAGSKWQSSVNPAATAWQSLPGNYHLSLNPQYSFINFQEGTALHVISESVTKEFEKFGTFQLSLAQIRSNERAMRFSIPDFRFSYDMDYMQVQWGKKFSADFAIGGNINYSSSEVTNKIGTDKFAYSSGDSYGLRIGTLYRIAEKLLGGIVFDYSQSPAKTIYYDTTPIFGFGIGDVEVSDRTTQYSFRAGPSYEYRKDSTVSLDYQFISVKNDMGKLEINRLFMGIDHRIIDALFVRGGFAVDNNGNNSWTGGLGIYPFKQLSIDLGYQYDMFPEIQSEFGRSHLYTLSISITL